MEAHAQAHVPFHQGGSEDSAGFKEHVLQDRLSAIMCCNADGTAKVDMAIIGSAKQPRRLWLQL